MKKTEQCEALRKAARQALETFEPYGEKYPHIITALREALAEQAEGVIVKTCPDGYGTITTEQAEQSQLADASLEPVAWVWTHEHGGERLEWEPSVATSAFTSKPLYAAPLAQQDTHATHVVRTKDPCHPWQDLTDDEIAMCMGKDLWNVYKNEVDFARAVIAADREKNK